MNTLPPVWAPTGLTCSCKGIAAVVAGAVIQQLVVGALTADGRQPRVARQQAVETVRATAAAAAGVLVDAVDAQRAVDAHAAVGLRALANGVAEAVTIAIATALEVVLRVGAKLAFIARVQVACKAIAVAARAGAAGVRVEATDTDGIVRRSCGDGGGFGCGGGGCGGGGRHFALMDAHSAKEAGAARQEIRRKVAIVVAAAVIEVGR